MLDLEKMNAYLKSDEGKAELDAYAEELKKAEVELIKNFNALPRDNPELIACLKKSISEQSHEYRQDEQGRRCEPVPRGDIATFLSRIKRPENEAVVSEFKDLPESVVLDGWSGIRMYKGICVVQYNGQGSVDTVHYNGEKIFHM